MFFENFSPGRDVDCLQRTQGVRGRGDCQGRGGQQTEDWVLCRGRRPHHLHPPWQYGHPKRENCQALVHFPSLKSQIQSRTQI